MNGFQIHWRGISAQLSASTIGKKIPNWTVGKSSLDGPAVSLRSRSPRPAAGRC
jgi:hypothetical protein